MWRRRGVIVGPHGHHGRHNVRKGLTQRAQQAISFAAQSEAKRRNANELLPEHIVLGIGAGPWRGSGPGTEGAYGRPARWG